MITELPMALKSNSACVWFWFLSTSLLSFAENITDGLQARQEIESLQENKVNFCSFLNTFNPIQKRKHGRHASNESLGSDAAELENAGTK